jgi:hypothetical protein
MRCLVEQQLMLQLLLNLRCCVNFYHIVTAVAAVLRLLLLLLLLLLQACGELSIMAEAADPCLTAAGSQAEKQLQQQLQVRCCVTAPHKLWGCDTVQIFNIFTHTSPTNADRPFIPCVILELPCFMLPASLSDTHTGPLIFVLVYIIHIYTVLSSVALAPAAGG